MLNEKNGTNKSVLSTLKHYFVSISYQPVTVQQKYVFY